jgi:hypothetical protein
MPYKIPGLAQNPWAAAPAREHRLAAPAANVALFRERAARYVSDVIPLTAGSLGRPRLRSGRINDAGDFAASISRETATLGVLSNGLLVPGNVDAVDLVARHIALYPLHLRPHAAQHAARFL